MSATPRRDLPLRLRTRGLRQALFEAFNDGEWHDISEALPIGRRLISPERALRTAIRTTGLASVEAGLLSLLKATLERPWATVEWEYGLGRRGVRARRRFRIPQGQAPRFIRPSLDEQQVIDIKLRLARGESPSSVAREHGVSRERVLQIRSRKYFADVVVIPDVVSEPGRANGLLEPTQQGGARKWKHKKRVRVTPTPESFAWHALKHLSSPDDVRRLIVLLKGALDEAPPVTRPSEVADD